MDQTEAAAIDAKYDNVRALLAAAQTRLGNGKTAYGYEFPADCGLGDFVLRVRKDVTFSDWLKQTTALNCVPKLLVGEHLG